MVTLDLKSRFKNKTFILSMVGAIVLLIQQLGFKDLMPSNYADIVNSVLSILVMLGIVVDTSTPGLNDKVVANSTIQEINAEEVVKTESSTKAINNTVTQNSASSKITVDNPENVQEIGVVVNPISASTPQ